MTDPQQRPVAYLDIEMVAQRLDVTSATVRDWSDRRLLPEPDAVQSGQPLWTAATMNTWAAQFRRALE